MDEILHTHHPVLAQVIFNQLVVGEGDTLLVNLAVTALVNEFADGLEGRVPVGDIGFDNLEHFPGGFGETDEYSIVDLEQPEELEDFPRLRSDFVDTIGRKKVSIGGN